MGSISHDDTANVSNPPAEKPIHVNRHLRVICVGAGASGIYLAYKLKHYFTDFELNVYERNPDIGGTWFENRYPGCACDIPAHNYVYSFEPNPEYSANYASAKEIFDYFDRFITKYGLRDYIHCNHEVVSAEWIEAESEWLVKIRYPDRTVVSQRCDFFINAAGILNAWRWPAIPGLKTYKGKLLHSAAWDASVDVAGTHVGLIGNGSSGIQILPQMQRQANHVTTFIREPSWISPTPGMEYRQYTDEERESFRKDPPTLIKLRKATETMTSSVFPIIMRNSGPQQEAEAYIKQEMVKKLNDDYLASKLIPDFSFGCRRITPGTNYLESLTLPNVTTIYGEITEVTETGCKMDDGKEYPVDILICATGFDTSFKPRFPVTGKDGRDLATEWATEPRSYLGLAASGYPNYFMFLGPNCPIANGPVIFAIELQGDYMIRMMSRWQKENIASFDAKREAVDDFMHQKDLFMDKTVWVSNCLSWYKNPVTSKITAVWPGSTLHYMETLSTPRYDDFEVKYNGRRFAYFGSGFSQLELTPGADIAYYIRNGDGHEGLFQDLLSTRNAKSLGNTLQGNSSKIFG